MKESDLYLPVKQFLSAQQYEVKAEVQDCDVLAVRANEPPVIVELKLSFNIKVVLQAVERLALTPKVYIGISKKCSVLKRQRRAIIKLLKMLGIGLLVIEPDLTIGCVDVLIDPMVYKPRQSKHKKDRLLGEFMQLVGDPNIGGSSTGKGKMTAYRQRALAIGGYLRNNGSSKASDVAHHLIIPKAREILYNNVYGWFVRESFGRYGLSAKGKSDTMVWEITIQGKK